MTADRDDQHPEDAQQEPPPGSRSEPTPRAAAPSVSEPEVDDDDWEDERESLFARTWVRVVLVLVIVGAAAAFALPYVIETVGTSTNPAVVSAPAPTAPAAPPTPAAPPSAGVASAVIPSTAAPASGPASEPPRQPPSAPVAVKPESTPQSAKATPPSDTPAVKVPTRESAEHPKVSNDADRPASASGGEAGDYWVQVGAYKDAATAGQVANRLRSRGYRVQELIVTRGASKAVDPATATDNPGDRYDVVVTGAPVKDLGPKLASKGLTVESTSRGAVVRPSLPLRDAVALSKDLHDDGLAVQVERARGSGPAPAGGGPETLHRVRVGAFADRPSAVAAVRELETRGYRPFIGSGRD